MLHPSTIAVTLVAHSRMAKRAHVRDQLVRRIHRHSDIAFARSPAVPVVAGTVADDGSLAIALAGAERIAALVALEDHPIPDERHLPATDNPIAGAQPSTLRVFSVPLTPNAFRQFLAQRGDRLAEKIVAVSTSEANDHATRGLTPRHQRDVVVELARHLFAVGARLACGGDFRKSGFVELLVEVQRAHTDFAGTALPKIVSYSSQPLSAEERARYADTVEFVEITQTEEECGAATVRGQALRLRAMRHHVSRDATALVAVGGRTSDFRGWRPGITEEIAAAAAAGKPVYLVGGFGGATRWYAEAAFLGRELPKASAPPGLGLEPTGALALPSEDEVIRVLQGRGLGNGLSRAENVHLANTVDPVEIVALVLRGLAKISTSQ